MKKTDPIEAYENTFRLISSDMHFYRDLRYRGPIRSDSDSVVELLRRKYARNLLSKIIHPNIKILTELSEKR